jgi:hypothetical protein
MRLGTVEHGRNAAVAPANRGGATAGVALANNRLTAGSKVRQSERSP